jgi:hypothetical protein
MRSKKVRKTEDVLREQEETVKRDRENAIARREQSNALAASGDNPWLEVSSELDKFVSASFVKFTKQGEFATSDTESISAGTRCVAHCDEIRLGWKKWEGGKPVTTAMGRVADRFLPPARKELGDTDERNWEPQDDGTRRDPWQFTMELPITRLDTGESFLFAVSSKGGIRAVNGLLRTYGARVKTKGEAAGLPIVELQPDSYKHRTYGKIFFPLLHSVGWTDPTTGKPLSFADELEDDLPDNLKGKAA